MSDIHDMLHDMAVKNYEMNKRGFCAYTNCKGNNDEFKSVKIYKSSKSICNFCLEIEKMHISECFVCHELIENYSLAEQEEYEPLHCKTCDLYVCSECKIDYCKIYKFYHDIVGNNSLCNKCVDIKKICTQCEMIVTDKDYLMIDNICCICKNDLWRETLPSLYYLEDYEEIVKKLENDNLWEY